MADISRKVYEINGIEKIAYHDGISWLNGKRIEDGLDHKDWRKITITYHTYQRKRRYELVEEPKKQVDRIFIEEKLTVKVIMDCRIYI